MITNTTAHLVDTNFIALHVETWYSAPTTLKVVPNPMSDRAVIEVSDGAYKKLQLRVYDLQGRTVLQTSSNVAGQLVVHRGRLLPGLYVFEVFSEDKPLGTGKLMIR